MHDEEPDLAVDEHLDSEWGSGGWSVGPIQAGAHNPNAGSQPGGRGVASTHLEHRRAPLQARELDREALVEGGGAVLGADCPVRWMGGGEGSSVGGPSEGDDDDEHEARHVRGREKDHRSAPLPRQLDLLQGGTPHHAVEGVVVDEEAAAVLPGRVEVDGGHPVVCGGGRACVRGRDDESRAVDRSTDRKARPSASRHCGACPRRQTRHGIQDAPSALNAGSCFSASTRIRADARMAAACCFRTNGGGEVASVWGPSSSVGVMPRAAVRVYTCVCVGTRERQPVVWVGGWVFEAWLRQMCGRFKSGRSGRVGSDGLVGAALEMNKKQRNIHSFLPPRSPK